MSNSSATHHVAQSISETGEAFRDIDGFPGYRCSDRGVIQSQWRLGPSTCMTGTWRTIRGGIARGHRYVWLFNAERKRCFRYVHELVLSTFIGPRPEGQEA